MIVQDLKNLLKSTITYVIEHEKDELDELVEEFKEEDNEGRVALELESLIEKVLNDPDNFEIVDDYDEIRAILGNNSSIPKLKALRFKMLLNKIQRERYRINAILSRLDEIDGEEHFVLVLKSLAREGLLSEEQFKKFMEKDAVLELKSIAEIIKQGIDSVEEEEKEEEEEEEEEEEGGMILRDKVARLINIPYYDQRGFPEGGGLREDEYEKMNRRRNRLLDVVRDYRSEAELLRDIDWTKSAHVF